MLRNIGKCYKIVVTMLFVSLLFYWGYNMPNVNEFLDIARSEMENLNLGKSFLLRDLFKYCEWDKISRSNYLLFGILVPNYIHTTDSKETAIEKFHLGQQKYLINNKKGGFS